MGQDLGQVPGWSRKHLRIYPSQAVHRGRGRHTGAGSDYRDRVAGHSTGAGALVKRGSDRPTQQQPNDMGTAMAQEDARSAAAQAQRDGLDQKLAKDVTSPGSYGHAKPYLAGPFGD